MGHLVEGVVEVAPSVLLAEEEGEEAMDVFSPEEQKLLTAAGLRLRFRLLDWLRRVFGG